MSTISSNIILLRKRKKKTQEIMSSELGITRARLGSYEENRAEPPIDMIVKIANYFEVSTDDLLLNKIKDVKNTGTK